MSYNQSYTFHVSGSVHYPASSSGGSKTYHDSVTVNVRVDTAPFDRSVDHCRTSVGALTAGASAAAIDIVSTKKRSFAMISKSIVEGFFGLITNEIRQKITQLIAQIPAEMQTLKNLAQRCLGKHTQMQKDYQRITSRYGQIFTELDNNMVTALRNLDSPVFSLVDSAGQVVFESATGEIPAQSFFGGEEQVSARMMLEIAQLKKSATSMISYARRNIGYGKDLNDAIEYMLAPIDRDDRHSRFLPVALMRTNGIEDVGQTREFQTPDGFADNQELNSFINTHFDEIALPKIISQEFDNIDQFYRKKVSSLVGQGEDGEKSARIAKYMLTLWDKSKKQLNEQ